MKSIDTVNLEITTHCNKRCPDCCVGIGINRTPQYHDWEYFKTAAKWIYGIRRVNLTGGEPTMHPAFAEYLPQFRDLFGCAELTMSTNGFKVQQYEDVIVEHLNWIDFTDYEDRRPALESIRKMMPVNSRHEGINGALFTQRASVGGGSSCARAYWRSFGCAYADGKFWGCCIAQSLPGAVPVEPSINWSERLMTTALPCSTCFFSEAAA